MNLNSNINFTGRPKILTVSNAAAQVAFASPVRVRCDADRPARIGGHIVDEQFQRLIVMRFDQTEQVFALLQHRIGTDDVVRVRLQAGQCGRTARFDVQNVPDIFGGILKGTEPDRDAQQALATPRIARPNGDLANILHFTVVDAHADVSVDVQFEDLLQRVVVVVEPSGAWMERTRLLDG